MPIGSMIAYFFAALSLTNAVPHMVAGMMGEPFQSPFAKPPGKGESSALVNVLWSFSNLLVGYVLLAHVGTFDIRDWLHAAPLLGGVLFMGVMLARTFSKLHGGDSPKDAT